MKIFVTGASGFIGSATVKELLTAGHEVIGLARSDESAKTVSDLGAQALKGSIEDFDILKQGASQVDGVIHTAFFHDFNQFAKANDMDKAAIEAMGEALYGTGKPIIVTGGILGLPKTNGFATEADAAPDFPRFSEAAAMALAERGVYASIVRLSPSVHGKGEKGFVPFIIGQALRNGVSAYVEDGNNRWPAIHRLDAALLYRLAVEKGIKGARYNAVAEEGIKIREIAELTGKTLNLPVKSLSGEDAAQHFEWMIRFIGFDEPATSYKTQELLGWKPKHIGLLEDMKENYF
ncbi:MAG: SDR family oxidoreductase [Prevotellaceae bacterium]|jgi:nucleoside-diphosphate-sugar epimerase|nr:SDR family oxidoreductase [Prevotellaceae bacterium]